VIAAAATACALLTTAEVAAVLKAPVREARPNRREEPGLVATQCFYLAEPFSRSVSVELTAAEAGETAKAKWNQAFHAPETATGKGEEKGKARPGRVRRLGDEAFWLPSRASGVLLVLRKNGFLRISVGGPESDKEKRRRSILLAQKALRRL
jgi:hypothetical protein